MTYTYKLSRRLASIPDTSRTLRPLVLLLLVLLATACGTGELVNPSTPATPDAGRATPGWVSLVLVTPNANDGAVQVSVTGPAMDSVQVTSGRGFTSLVNGTARILVAGTLGTGPVARLWIADTRKIALYSATVEQAAVRGTYQLQDVSAGYAASVSR